jgi:phospholipase/carboxylesterase
MPLNPYLSKPLIFIPKHGEPLQLFVLLHGEAAGPQQLFPLADIIKQSFPQALVYLPYGFFCEDTSPERQDMPTSDTLTYHWIEQAGLTSANYAARVRQALPGLLAQIQQIQSQFGLSGQQTALAGFSQGATMALEASQMKFDVAGRVLAFSGIYASSPQELSPATMLHFFQGENDKLVSAAEVEATLAHLATLQGDATLDVASSIGHELHESLLKQAIVRLKTCVPLRSWEAAFEMLKAAAQDNQAGQDQDPEGLSPGCGDRTLH